ncbi:hypothetical protein H5410_046083 [Solanum commersonii]|uniref:Uncharacterized protein n=1 Tax=Solanum commersonii TaxID=4109 RepID=A0A9J5XBB1_SOLCO|nr:hypothetical protein H5410_046083 [Solanum commersonii]
MTDGFSKIQEGHRRRANLNIEHNNIGLPNDNNDKLQITYSTKKVEPITMKTITYTIGILLVMWTEKEVKRMNIIENLQYAIVGKFSYG